MRKVVEGAKKLLKKNELFYGLAKMLYARLFYKYVNDGDSRIEERSGDKKAIFIDVSSICVSDAHTGIQRVVKNIYRSFVDNYGHEFEILPVYAELCKAGYHIAKMKKKDGVRFVKGNEPLGVRAGDIFLGLDFCPDIALAQKNYLFSLWQKGVSVNLIIYDIIQLRHREYFAFGDGAIEEAWLKAMSQFANFICISRSVREEATDWLKHKGINVPDKRMHWFHLGCDRDIFQANVNFVDNARIPAKPYFLLVSTIEPRKGHVQALEAMELLWEAGLPNALVFVGKKGWKVSGLCSNMERHLEMGKRLYWFQDCGDSQLGALYANADCVLMPSEAEGFGLAIIEGAAFKKPLILRDLPVFREIAGDGAFYFSGRKAEDLAQAIRKWLDLHSRGMQPSSERIKINTWNDSAGELFKAINTQFG